MKIVRGIAIAVLAFLGVSAIAGSLPLMVDPSGALMHMPLTLLRFSPFHTFLIPGIILLLANGVLSLLVAFAVVGKWRGYGWMIAFQGCVVAGWITVEVLLLREVVWLHALYVTVGLVLIVLGMMLTRK
jgi:hypothetical protein